MRLIDADKLIEEWNDMGVSMNPDVFEKQVDDLINNQPTAYNVDKVIAELEEGILDNVDCYTGEPCNNPCVDCENHTIRKHIEIVRKGGVEPAAPDPKPKEPLPNWKQALLRTFLGRN